MTCPSSLPAGRPDGHRTGSPSRPADPGCLALTAKACGSAARGPGAWNPLERRYHQFSTPAVTAAAIPVSSDATAATCQGDGPTTAIRPSPSGPPAKAAPPPRTLPVSTPPQNPLVD